MIKVVVAATSTQMCCPSDSLLNLRERKGNALKKGKGK
jgi:hypothetical protein